MSTERLDPEQLRWDCDESTLGFETTETVDPASRIIGQDTAREALLFGLQCDAYGQNVFVRGERGTGRITMVKRLLDELKPITRKKHDYAYVHNFNRPDRPRLLVLPQGKAKEFSKRIAEVARYIDDGLARTLENEPWASQRNALKESIQGRVAEASREFEADLASNSMGLISAKQGPLTTPLIVPLIEGEPVPPEKFMEMARSGEVPEDQVTAFREKFGEFQKRLAEVSKSVNQVLREGNKELESFLQNAARELIANLTDSIIDNFGECQGVKKFIDEVVDDAVENRLQESPEEDQAIDLEDLYGVNIVMSHSDSADRPVVEETVPSAMNLLGTVDQKPGPGGAAISDYRGIRAGSILSANHGYLIISAEELLSEPGGYHSLMRTLRTGRLEIVPPESGWMRPYVVIQPEPIPVEVRVILIGDVITWYKLDHFDADFRDLFKVLADFDDQVPRNEAAVMQYAAVLSQLARNESLPHFENTAVTALAEHGARIAARGGKMTAKFGRIADLAREAAFVATNRDRASIVTGDHVIEAVRRTKERANLPSRRFQELIKNRTIMIETDGEAVGQINGLAVMHAGPLTYGFPARITAAIGPGRAGLINIEGSAKMSGSIHTKGFHILGGLLMNLLRLPHPLAFTASLAFEQSYGGIDGDSASGAEMVCLLSALTGVPVRQGMAMTGAIDQKGNLEAIGGVNEKIEGFFDACRFGGLTGDQGVVIPAANAPDLMLRRDVVDACRKGQFHVYATSRFSEALELMTGTPAGDWTPSGYPDGSLLATAVKKAGEYWRQTLSSPDRLTTVHSDSNRSGDPVGTVDIPDDQTGI